MEIYREEKIYAPFALILHHMGGVKDAVEEILRMPYFALHQIRTEQVSGPQSNIIRARTMMVRRPCDDELEYRGYVTDPDVMIDEYWQSLPSDQQKYSGTGVLIYRDKLLISSDAVTILGRDSIHNTVPDGCNYYTDGSFGDLVWMVSTWREVYDAEFRFCNDEPKNLTKRTS